MFFIGSPLIWAHSLGAHTGMPASETLWICQWPRQNLIKKILLLIFFCRLGWFIKNWWTKCWQSNQNVSKNINMFLDTYVLHFIKKKDPILQEEFDINYKKIEKFRKVNRLIMLNILKWIGMTLRTHGKEWNPLFLEKP